MYKIMFFLMVSTGLSASINVFYGEDTRNDMYTIKDQKLHDLGNSTAAIVPTREIFEVADDNFLLSDLSFGRDHYLCKDERFYHQPAAANCSSFLIGDDLVATAAHCIDVEDCKADKFKFVFGYKMNNENEAQLSFQSKDIYSCKEVVIFNYTFPDDYAVVRLDRKVPNKTHFKLSSIEVKDHETFSMLGYPSGLPLKYTNKGTIMERKEGYFKARIDSFKGNSGSPVIRDSDLSVIGIIVRGSRDIVYNQERSCVEVVDCDNGGLCYGEEINYIEPVIKELKNIILK